MTYKRIVDLAEKQCGLTDLETSAEEMAAFGSICEGIGANTMLSSIIEYLAKRIQVEQSDTKSCLEIIKDNFEKQLQERQSAQMVDFSDKVKYARAELSARN